MLKKLDMFLIFPSHTYYRPPLGVFALHSLFLYSDTPLPRAPSFQLAQAIFEPNLFPEVFLNVTEVCLTLTEVFPCFFLSCKADARLKLAKTGHSPHFSTLVVICVVLCIVCV